MSSPKSTEAQLVCKDAPPIVSASSLDLSPVPNVPSRVKDSHANIPQSPGSDEGFVSAFFAPTSSANATTFSTPTLPHSTWKGNFRSNLSVDSQSPSSIVSGRRNRSRKAPLTVTLSPSETPSLDSFIPTPPSSICTSVTEPTISSLTTLPSNSADLKVDSRMVTNDSGTNSQSYNEISTAETEVSQPETDPKILSRINDDGSETTRIDFYQMDEDQVTPLHVAVLDDVDASFFLISKAENPTQLNMHNKFGSSPIHLAAKVGNSNSLRDLILGGANVEERDAVGDTALHIACRRGHYDSVRSATTPLSVDDHVITSYLPPYQRLPQRLDMVNYDGLTCLHLASMHRHTKIIKELVRLGADVDAPEAKSGRTPLHFAVERKDTEIVRYLLERCKADVDAETFDGATALCLAEGRGFQSMASLLRGYGADPTKGIQAWRRREESDYGSDFDSGEEALNSC